MTELIFPIITFFLNIAPILIFAVVFYIHCYKKCPPKRAIVVYGKTDNSFVPKVITSGGVFVIPIVQDYALLSLDLMRIDINTTNAFSKGILTKNNLRVNIKADFTFAISKNPYIIQNAAEKLLGLKPSDIKKWVKDIILSQLRLVTATFTKEEIINNENLNEEITKNINIELNKIGIEIINTGAIEITELSGYQETEEISDKKDSFEEEFKELVQKANNEQAEIYEPIETTEEMIEEIIEEQPQEVYEPQTEFTQDSVTNTDETQAQIDDIFASTRKYFENNGNT